VPRLLTIGVFARRTGLSVSALRFYDGAGLLVPVEVDASSGYRRYDETQVEAAMLIRDLRRLDLSLAAIEGFLAAPGEARKRTLAAHLGAMSVRLQEAHDLAARLGARIDHQPKEQIPMTTMIVDTRDLAEAIDQVAPAASTDPESPLLHTVLVEAREGSLRLVATDRYRLAVRDLVARGGDGAAFRGVVASAAVQRIRKTLGDGERIDVTHEEHALVVGDDPSTGKLYLIPAEFPPYEKLLVLDPDAHSLIVERGAIVDALQSAVGRDVVRLTLSDGQLTLDGETPHSIPARYQGPELVVGMHPAFAHFAASSAVGAEVMIDVTEPMKPVVFRSATDSSYICMVMPIRLADEAA
jgi:DNA-binding transcriptional MerR regulator